MSYFEPHLTAPLQAPFPPDTKIAAPFTQNEQADEWNLKIFIQTAFSGSVFNNGLDGHDIPINFKIHSTGLQLERLIKHNLWFVNPIFRLSLAHGEGTIESQPSDTQNLADAYSNISMSTLALMLGISKDFVLGNGFNLRTTAGFGLIAGRYQYTHTQKGNEVLVNQCKNFVELFSAEANPKEIFSCPLDAVFGTYMGRHYTTSVEITNAMGFAGLEFNLEDIDEKQDQAVPPYLWILRLSAGFKF